MTTFSAPDVSAISPPKLSPFPVPDAKDVCVDDDGAIDQSRMLASPKLSIPHSVKTHEPEGSRLLLTHLRGRTAQQQQQLALGGRMIQAEQNERWAEMSAWCGFLATNLEGACCRIEQMGEEKRVLDRATAEDRNTIRHLEYSVSHKNVKHLEQKIEKLQAEVREREAELEQVHEDLRNGIPVSLSRENTSFLSAFCAEAFIEAGMDADEKEKEQAKEPEPNSPPKSVLLKRMSTATRSRSSPPRRQSRMPRRVTRSARRRTSPRCRTGRSTRGSSRSTCSRSSRIVSSATCAPRAAR